MARVPSRVFHNMAEFEAETEMITKNAMKSTVEYFKKMLSEFAQKDIYNNAYKATWYVRSNWLKAEDAIEAYIYKNTKNAWGGGVRFNKSAYDSIERRPFQHGNADSYLPMNSYLEIMNDSSKLHENPWHFPTHTEIDRGSFYDEFLDKVKEIGIDTIFKAFFDARTKQEITGRVIMPNLPKW
jgi:hypothetical protein